MFSKSFLRDPFSRTRFCTAALATTLVVVALTACGGGGGSGAAPATGGNPPGGSGTDTVVVTTPTMTVTYTATNSCWSGPNLTSTVSQAAANALVPNACPALPATEYSATSVVPSTSTLTLTINNLPAVFTDGVLTATGLASGGTWDVVSTATGITVTPRGGTSLNWVTSYSGNLVMNFAGAPSASKTITFTTGADPSVVVCTAPAMLTTANTCISPPAATGYTWNAVVKVWVADRGVYITSINTLPATCLNIGDACYLANAADGTIKFVQGPTSVMFAVYQTADGYLNRFPINSDGTPNNAAPLLTNGGVSGSALDYVVGTISGIIQKVTFTATCFELTFTTMWGNSQVTCPVGP
jgi:hypothetical protein